ncbi:MAG: NAD(P)-dependent alcohol dehydrogenase, partial [Chloroflexota bacterium]
VGTASVQLAKYYGAEVTGVCSTANMELVQSIGADHVVDYTHDDFTESGQHYDIIFDTVGKAPVSRSKRVLTPNGVFLANVITPAVLVQMLWTSVRGSTKVVSGIASEKTEDLLLIKDLMEAGKLKPVVDRTYPLDEIVDAHRYADTGHKKGNVVITVDRAREP